VAPDAIAELVHDHAELNRDVLALATMITNDAPAQALKPRLEELREHLFTHFAREEEGLFPFVADHFPDLADRVHAMSTAHDAICGAVARMCYLLAGNTNGSAVLRPLFERFQLSYAQHARVEGELLSSLRDRLTDEERTALAALVRDL
jgi:hypothetical protein